LRPSLPKALSNPERDGMLADFVRGRGKLILLR
jgi:hypothetical protein